MLQNNKIPSAEQMLIDACIAEGFTESYAKSIFKINPDSSSIYVTNIIKFAQMHVQAALKEASKNATGCISYTLDGDIVSIDDDSILNAYPLTNIK
jgi:hypothetical protein